MTMRAMPISAAKKPNAELRASARTARRNAAGQPMANGGEIDAGAQRDGKQMRDPRTGEDQPDLEIEPGRGDPATDRANRCLMNS